MPTSKLLRAAPPKNLDDYVASSRKLFGEPESIPDSAFTFNNFVARGTAPNTESSNFISQIPLGFKLKINNRVYSTATIAVSGWMVLEGDTTFVLSDILTGAVYENENIASTFRVPHILLAPWFDQLWPVSNSVQTLLSANWYDNTTQLDDQTVKDINEGINKESWPFSFTDRGVRYHRGFDKNFGRYFLCRWTTAKRYILDHGRMKFEAVIFENGRIEFRYWPNFYYKKSTAVPAVSVDVDATVGIFYNFPAGYKFRDFAPLLDYTFNDLANQRQISELGGSKYDIGYSDAGSPYSTRIRQPQRDSRGRWPNNGAVIVFSPPANSYKILPQKIVKQINASKNVVRQPGLFDDRRTVIFSNNIGVFYPSTLPNRLLGDTGDVDVSLRQILLTSGSSLNASASMKATGSVNKAAIDGFLTQLEGISHDFYKKDLSFNEYYKDFKVNDSSLPFFSTGSKLEIFGEGFTAPLKSKTQFHLSLPINELTILPATRSCVVYYDQEKKKWSNIIDSTVGFFLDAEPEAISIEYDPAPPNLYPYEKDEQFYYRVTETSRMFDAVGRKITLSTERNNFGTGGFSIPSYQRDDIIGLIVNTDDTLSQSKLNEALAREYPASVTDNERYNPVKGQKIKLPIDYPFLIEKIVVEFPFFAASDWFNDKTTCKRPLIERVFPAISPIDAEYAGPMDFGGPGLTFSVHCARKCLDFYKMDLIASGTVTHEFDAVENVVMSQDSAFGAVGSDSKVNFAIRPEGFLKFSNPTTVLKPNYFGGSAFLGKVRLEMESAVSSGITYSRNERRPDNSSPLFTNVNVSHAIDLTTKKVVSIDGSDVNLPMQKKYNLNDIRHPGAPAAWGGDVDQYKSSSPRIHVHEVHPLSRGASGIYFNGNSILGGTIASIPTKTNFENQLFVAEDPSGLPSSWTDVSTGYFSDRFFRFDAVSMYSTFTSKPSPYLLMPGEELTFAISKTRSVLKIASANDEVGNSGFFDVPPNFHHKTYDLSSSHSVIMPTGSLEVTIYGSYVREGMEYHL